MLDLRLPLPRAMPCPQPLRHAFARLPLIALALLPGKAGAWGSGHADWQRQLHEALPPAFMERIAPETAELAIREWSKYPDSFESFESEAELIGPEGLATLLRHGVARRYDLHSERARAVAFLLLVEALREGRDEAALFWVASIGHSVADMPACNHDPLLHLATYDWSQIPLRLAGGAELREAVGMLDLSHVARHPEGHAALAAAVARLRLGDDGRNARTALLEIMRYGQEGAAFCATRGPRIWEAALARVAADNSETRAALFEPIAELGAWALVRVARDFEMAQRLAASREALPEIDEALLARHAEEIDALLADRRLEDEALFSGLLRPLDQGGASIGVALEPTWRMNEGITGFGDRVLSAMVCRSLGDAGIRYATLDLREIAESGLPDPAAIPILVLAAREIRSYHTYRREALEEALRGYRKSGGAVLWVGGGHRPLAAPALAAALSEAKPGPWPVAAESLPGSRLVLAASASSAGGEWTFLRNPQTPAGWHRPQGPLHFSEAGESVEGIDALLELRSGGDRFLVGAIERPPDEPDTGPLAWLPVYALHPWLHVEPRTVEAASLLRLDEAGGRIFHAVLERLSD
jgi:hypothetical protein